MAHRPLALVSAIRLGRLGVGGHPTAWFVDFGMGDDAAGSTPPLRGTPARVYRLGEEPGDDLSSSTTAAERVAMVWDLSARMWEMGGRPAPTYTRATMPVVVTRSRD
jgi:hypothetical protein